MIWTAERNTQQGALVAALYQQASSVLCNHQAVWVGGLPGADKTAVLAQAGIDADRYLAISVDRVLVAMAERGLIPQVPGLSPLDAADLAHAEAQFLAKRLGMRALGEGRNLLWEVSYASPHSIESWLSAHQHAGYTTTGIFAEISIEESVRRTEASQRPRP